MKVFKRFYLFTACLTAGIIVFMLDFLFSILIHCCPVNSTGLSTTLTLSGLGYIYTIRDMNGIRRLRHAVNTSMYARMPRPCGIRSQATGPIHASNC